ncbi:MULTISPECIES: Ldh family oxidoreductase [Alphaproteobacteria]|uniref:Oxidoreductase n=2 Tax=Alphaproteobacteria TaxID=28211 RepID=A0A512HQ32_9HYPH|nr:MULTISPECIES: Ldh family oxidoreductase [Alphaproteobacteria]GEO87551.1 oxidoreductase [Ciceribacter naphthalenivorans]GLR23536.1 oxidoreductase [Ciceribacter naphthalenivorans]GLT06392.1 oxidoreductase [Sphingomonas psychrolutea]
MSQDLEYIPLEDAKCLATDILLAAGLSEGHAEAIAKSVVSAQRDECFSHGLWRLLGCVATVSKGKVDPKAVPAIDASAPGIVKVDAKFGFSLLAFREGLPDLIGKANRFGIAAMAINHCYHFSALWPEIEEITEAGLVALAMTPSHSWVAPAGGKKPVFGTNPIAFGWPRPASNPFVFDFATSAAARGEIELHRRAGKPIPLGWAIDSDGNDTADATKAMEGAMLTFGGHKGSALSAMIELMAGPLIADMTSAESMAFDEGAGVAPCHGEIIIALDPKVFLGSGMEQNMRRAEDMFAAITSQGARLPSQRRYEARARNESRGIPVQTSLLEELKSTLASLA